MNENLEQMLRILPMNQIDLASRGEGIDQTIETLKALKEQGPLGSNTLAGQA